MRRKGLTAVLMFAYSFLAMAGYNVVKPATRSQFIESLGADNIPYVQLVAGLIMGFVIQGYTSAMRLLPRRWVFAATQAVMVGLLLVFWMLFKTAQSWVSVAFYLLGCAGRQSAHQPVLVARQRHLRRRARRSASSASSAAAPASAASSVRASPDSSRATIGTNNLLLVGGCAPRHLRRDRLGSSRSGKSRAPTEASAPGTKEKGMSPREAVALLIKSKHFQIIALVISFAAIGAGIVEQQVNMAAAAANPGQGWTDRVSRQRHLLFVDCRLHHSDDADVAGSPATSESASRCCSCRSRSVEPAC